MCVSGVRSAVYVQLPSTIQRCVKSVKGSFNRMPKCYGHRRTIDSEDRLGDDTSIQKVEVNLRWNLGGDSDGAILVLQ